MMIHDWWLKAETLYLTHMIDFMQTYVENVETSHNEVGQVENNGTYNKCRGQ